MTASFAFSTGLATPTFSGDGHHGFPAVGQVESPSGLELRHDSEGAVLLALRLGLAHRVADGAAALALVRAQRDADVAAPAPAAQARVIGRS
jgi:hypothetical protein